jgi:hypothetical protein
MTGRRRRVICGAVILVGTVALVVVAMHPLWYLSEAGVRSWLLQKVPEGSSVEQLKAIASTEGWRVESTWSGSEPHADWGGIDGSTIVWIYLGGHRLVFRVDYDSFWAFDTDGRLVDVRVRKMVDAL